MGVRDTAPVWDELPMLIDMGFEAIAKELVELKQQIELLQTQQKTVALEAEAMLTAVNIKRVKYGDKYCVEQSNGSSASKISGKLLASKGVPADTIKECTIPGKKYTYIQVIDLTKQKKEYEGGEETEG